MLFSNLKLGFNRQNYATTIMFVSQSNYWEMNSFIYSNKCARLLAMWVDTFHSERGWAQGLQITNMALIERSFYLLNARNIYASFLHNLAQCIGFSLLLHQEPYGDGTETVSLGMRADPWYGTIFLFWEQIAPSWRHKSTHVSWFLAWTLSRYGINYWELQDSLADFSQWWQEIRNQSSSMYFYAPG